MADFIDDEASEVSSSEEEESENESRSKNKKQKKIAREISDSSEEDEEEDEEDEEEMKDLINDEEEEEEDDGDDDDDGAGTKRSHDDDDDDENSSLDNDDFDLIEENTGARIEKKKKFKRIRAIADDDSDEEEADEGRKIQNELFGPEGLLDSDDENVHKQKTKPADRDLNLAIDDDDEDSESEDNFIVDDDDQPIVKKTKKKGARYTDSAMQQAQEIFGVDFDYDEIEDEDEDDEGDYDEDYDEEDEIGEPRARKKKEGRKTIYDVYEPSELERSHMTTRDQEIRAKDEPERFQLRPISVTGAPQEELDQESEWIFRMAFDQPTISIQNREREPIAGKRSEVIIPEIHYALNCMRNEKLEPSFIAAYRREYIPSLSASFDDTRDLWTIFKLDEQWCKLQASKESILNLYKDMRSYIESKPEDSRIRKITDSDIERVHSAKNFFDLEDCRAHFRLHYSYLTTEMKLHNLDQKIKEIQQKRVETLKSKAVPKENGDSGVDHEEEDERQPEEEDVQEDEDDTQETKEEKLYKRLSKFKISSSRDSYNKCREDHVGELVRKFGLTPEQFGENLRDDYQRNSVSQNYVRPLDEAANHIRPGMRFTNRDAILKAATYMYSREIGYDPLVRQTLRKYFFENAVISIRPTISRMNEIVEDHPCYPFKFLKNKPVSRLVGDQFLHIVNAEKDKLIEVHFSIEPIDSIDQKNSKVSPYHESLKALYYSDFSSIVTKEWNELREEAVKTAMNNILLPSFEKQLREKLVREAQERIIRDSCEKLHNWLNIGPYAPASAFDDYEDFELRNGTRICGFTFAPEGDAPCFAAIIDSEGELIDHIRLPYLNIRKRPDRMTATERENQAKDKAKFKQFLINRKPHVVALGAETIQTKYICQELAQILDELRANDGLPLITIEIVDNELSSVFMNLKTSTEEFPEFPPLLLQAISNARRLNDPLSEYAKLFTPDNDILCIRFHPLQDDLPKEEFINNLTYKMVTRTNAVGVDPDRAIAHPHTANLMQFIAGLGPRKAAHLLRSIKKLPTGGQLVNRQSLVKDIGMTAVIFINCAGFIKLDTDTLSDDFPDEAISPLDSTRIHPQSYGLARKIASDALDYEEGASDETTANCIEEILDCPDKLDDLDLAAFAKELEHVQKQGKKGFTLQMIREEIQCRYKDHREPYRGPSTEEIFTMLTKETTDTFYHGKLVTCQVVAIIRKKPGTSQLDSANPVKIDDTNLWRCPFCMRSDFQDLSVVWNHFDTDDCPGYAIGVRCRLDNGLSGFIPTKFISDKNIMDPSERVAVGQTIQARVMKVDTEKFSCDLTCRSSDLQDIEGKLKPMKDEYYDEAAKEAFKRDMEMKKQQRARRPYCKRVIIHPSFANIDHKTCEKRLQEMEQGYAIIRPSSQGQDYLTLSWKVAKGIHQHVLIREEGKENSISLGHQLFIDKEPYEDLDEIIARYVNPLASYAREILNYKYCLQLPEGVNEMDFLQEKLFTEKKISPTLPYRFCPSRNYPGKFLLGIIPSHKPYIEYLTITPQGYRFRNYYFKNLAHLIKWFKENYNKIPRLDGSTTSSATHF